MNLLSELQKSALTTSGEFIETEEALNWIKHQNEQVNVQIEKTSIHRIKDWTFDNEFGILKHKSGGFFSIEGITVQTNKGPINEWDQPIINQPEIGYLGFLVRKIKGILHFLVQAKIEPGNINHVQLSPTIQATKSNYTLKHKGKKPKYLEYFVNAKGKNILLDQLQSEQGARFLKKRNRNIIVLLEEDIEVYDNFLWLSLGQIKQLMLADNVVNMDTRTVISGIPLFNNKSKIHNDLTTPKALIFSNLSKNNSDFALNDFSSILSFITTQKCKYELKVTYKSLKQLNSWNVGELEIHHANHLYFSVIGANIFINNREVHNWSQPLIKPKQKGLCAFIIKIINGTPHFLVQSKLECGNFDTIELAPTVQCLTGDYTKANSDSVPYLNYILNAEKDNVILDVMQSEEGGRFYQEENRNIIIIVDDNFSEEVHEDFIWMTISQVQILIQFNNFFNIQARSLISHLV